MKIAERVKTLPPYVFAVVQQRIGALRARGVDVIDLGMGSPDMAPPQFILDALCQSAANPRNHGYAGYFGAPSLRKAIAGYYHRRFGVELDPETEVRPLIGSKEGLANMALAFVDPGDLVLAPDPGYPTYSMGTQMAGGTTWPMPIVEANDYLVDFDAIPPDVAAKATLMWLDYPNNPTGAAAPLEFLARAVEFARAYDIVICYDNPYVDLTFDGYVAPSILEVPGAKHVAVEFNSLSKTYNMAGWRVGMAVGNAEAIQALTVIKTNIDSGIFQPLQDAAVVALNGDQTWLAGRNLIYQRRRDAMLDWLPSIGMSARAPKGALYVWARVPDGVTCEAFATDVLERAGVWMTPGTAFGEHGAGYVRLSLCLPEERLREAGERVAKL